MNIITTLIPNQTKARPGTKLKRFRGVTIHETDNYRLGANAYSHSQYMTVNGGFNEYRSYHYVVDDKEAYLLIPEDEMAYHAGDGAGGVGNTQTIAIEICVNPDIDLDLARKNAANLAAQILKRHSQLLVVDGELNYDSGNLFQHHTFSPWSKNCPSLIRNLGIWSDFVENVAEYLSPTLKTPNTKVELYRIRKSWEDVSSQIGAYSNLSYAIRLVEDNPEYKIFDSNGIEVIHTVNQPVNIGDKVRVIENSVTYSGGSLASFVYNRDHLVNSIVEDRAVISYNGVIVAAINVRDLEVI